MQTELLLTTIDEQSTRPSFFELFIVQQINGLIKPALRHIVHYIADQHHVPELFENFDGVYTAIITTVQWYCISMYNATLVESLNGLSRRSGEGSASLSDWWLNLRPLYHLRSAWGSRSGGAAADSGRVALHDWQKVISILYAVILPQIIGFLRERALRYKEIMRFRRERLREVDEETNPEAYEGVASLSSVPRTVTSWAAEALSDALAQSWTGLCTALAEGFPYLELAADASVVGFQLMYICGLTDAHHPLFAVFDMVLEKNKSTRSYNQLTTETALSSRDTSSEIANGQNASIAGGGMASTLQYSMGAVLVVLVALRAAETLLATSESGVPTLSERLAPPIKVPPPPKPSPVGRGCVLPPADKTKCPLCNGQRNNACASSSGYVFCYICLLNHVREHGKCPVTGLPCAEEDIIRLFEST